MRRRLVMAIAFLSLSLVAGTCEFRASSNHPVTPPPPEVEPTPTQQGLLVDLSVGDSGASAQGSFGQTSIVAAALSASVLSLPVSEPSPTNDFDPATLGPDSRELFSVSSISAKDQPIGNPVPEPTALWLYGLGSLFMAWRIRRATAASQLD